jgi:hypothetical protein
MQQKSRAKRGFFIRESYKLLFLLVFIFLRGEFNIFRQAVRDG